MRRFLERLFPTLAKKIAVAVTAVLLVGGGTFVFFAHQTGYRLLQEQAQVKAEGVANLMTGILEHAMLEGQSGHIRHSLAQVTRSDYVVNAYLLQTDGHVIVQARAGGPVLDSLPLHLFEDLPGVSGGKVVLLREHDSSYQYILAPIVRKPGCESCHADTARTMGYLGVKLAMDDIRAVTREHRTLNIAMTIITFGGLGAIIFLALSFLVIKPIGRLHSHIRQIEGALRKIESGDAAGLPTLREPETNDEIADLCRDFNNLITRLNATNAKLREMHEQQLEQADRLASTGEMAAGIAHEIRNPIAGVLGALQVFDGDLPPGDAKKEILAEMMVQIERVNHAVTDLLSYARPTPPVLETVGVNDLIQRTLSLFRQQNRGITFVLDLMEDGADVIAADRKQMQQVLWNIMLNAVQAMEGHGTLTIASVLCAARVEIRVTDTGRGITPEQLERVFKPFYTTKHKGTGLGMTISKRIIDQHGGSIAIASTPGAGTTVTLTLPPARTDPGTREGSAS